MPWLAVLFAILAVLFGVWGFATAVVWEGIRILFWACVALFVLSLMGSLVRDTGPQRPMV
jgi:hypothetical protein